MINLTGVSFPVSLHTLERNLGDVERMLAAAPTRRSQNPQPQSTAEAIYRGTTVLICAAWETFVEDLALDTISRIAYRHENGGRFTAIAQEVAVRVAARIGREGLSRRDPTALLGSRNVFLGAFDAPKSANVDSMFRRTFDIEDFSRSWSTDSGVSDAARRLDALVKLRGDIAHRSKGAKPVQKSDVKGFVDLVERISIVSSNRLRLWFHEATGEYPSGWGEISVRSVA